MRISYMDIVMEIVGPMEGNIVSAFQIAELHI
jgi:hypothetical protein